MTAFLVESRWSALYLYVQSSALGLALVAAAALLVPGDFVGPPWAIRTFAVVLAVALGGLAWLRLIMRVSSARIMGPLVGGFRHEDGTTLSPAMGTGGVAGFSVA
ncbi:MAG: hypothetical protein M3276_03600 [Actinomycetota bacterium]|nr:hypothetical protein [Actinomycetota bacterium]